MKYGPEDVFYVEFKDYGRHGCTAFERHTCIKVEADSKEDARQEMTRLLTEWEMSRPDPDEAPIPSIEEIRISRQ